jgi:cytoskeletal protein RodZ
MSLATMPQAVPISIADLDAAGLRLRPFEAATIARDVAQQVARGALPGVPSVHVLRLTADGRITVEGPVEAGGRAVPRAAQLLDALLPGFDAPPEWRVPGALRLVVARALRTLDLPPYPSLDSFIDALARFAAPDSRPIISDLVTWWQEATDLQTQERAAPAPTPEPVPEPAPAAGPGPPAGALAHMPAAPAPLTISDIRRARRATGLTLGDVATRSRIPTWLLRELEWGYYRNWPEGHYGRTQLVRYARAAGLDDQVVVRTLWPAVEREARSAERAVVPAMEWTEGEVVPDGEVLTEPPAQPAAGSSGSPRRRMLAALAIPALLAIGLVPGLLQRRAADEPAAPVQASQAAARAATAEPVGTDPQERSASGAVAGPEVAASARDRGAEAAAPAPASARPSSGNARPDGPAGDDPPPSPVGAEGAIAASSYSPAFSSVGAAMFYHTASDGQSALMRADTDSHGTVLRVTSVVDDDAANYHPRPSPDGRRIAFDSDRDGERAVYVAQADGSDVRRVSGDGFAAIPSWSPDGGTLAYVRAEADRPRVWNIWTTDLETGETRRLTSYRVGQPWGASWFPDGRRVAYSHETRLVVLDLESGAERVFQSPIKGRLVRTPAVSPDGRRIMFQVHRDGAWLMNVSDGSMRKVLSDPTAEEYTWAPDGRRVAYHSRQSGNWGVWVMASR